MARIFERVQLTLDLSSKCGIARIGEHAENARSLFSSYWIAIAGWMNQRQQQMIEYLREENRVLREQLE